VLHELGKPADDLGVEVRPVGEPLGHWRELVLDLDPGRLAHRFALLEAFAIWSRLRLRFFARSNQAAFSFEFCRPIWFFALFFRRFPPIYGSKPGPRRSAPMLMTMRPAKITTAAMKIQNAIRFTLAAWASC